MAEDFHVKGKVSVDGSSLGRAADSIKTGLSRAFGSVAGSFRGALLSVFSAGALAALIGNNLRKAFDTTVAAGKTGVTEQEYSALLRLSEQSGVSIDDLAKKYVKAKEEGTEFATQVQRVTKELVDNGLIPSTEQTQAMARAMLIVADATAKVATQLADVIENIDKLTQQGTGGVTGWLTESIRRTGLLGLGKVQEMLGQYLLKNKKDTHEILGNSLLQSGLENQLAGYGVSGDALPLPNRPKRTTINFDELLAFLRRDAQEGFKKDAFGTGNKSQPFPVSNSTQVGLFWTKGNGILTAQEYQLKLVNRKLDDLVATVKRGQM